MGWELPHSRSCPTTPHRSRAGQRPAGAAPALGVGHLSAVSQGWNRRSGCLGSLPHVTKAMDHQRLLCLCVSPELKARHARAGCSQSPHSLLTRQERIAESAFPLLKGEEGKALLMPYHLVVTFPLCVIFAPVIHSISKGW